MSDYLTVQEFAERLKLTTPAVYIAIKEKRVAHEHILGRVAIPRSELKRFKKRRNGNLGRKVLYAADTL